MADVSAYWKETKKEAKKITGVEKMSAGWINGGSGIAKPLDAYVLAWMTKKDYVKPAKVALEKIDKYLNTIVEKEVKDIEKKANGKAGLSDAEKKSAKIIRNNLRNIRDELGAVVKGKKAGDFKADARTDIQKTLEDPVHREALVEYEQGAANAIKLSKKYIKIYEDRLKNIKQTQNAAMGELQRAKASHGKTDEQTNQAALTHLKNFSLGAIADLKAVTDHYQKNVDDHKDYLPARTSQLVDKKGKILKISKVHEKRRAKAFNALDAHCRRMLELQAQIKSAAAEVQGIALKADAFSVAPLDMSKIVGRVDAFVEDCKEVARVLKTASTAYLDKTAKVDKMFDAYKNMDVDMVQVYMMNTKQLENAMEKVETSARKLGQMEAWLRSCQKEASHPLVKKKVAYIVSTLKTGKAQVTPCLKKKGAAEAALKKAARQLKEYMAERGVAA